MEAHEDPGAGGRRMNLGKGSGSKLKDSVASRPRSKSHQTKDMPEPPTSISRDLSESHGEEKAKEKEVVLEKKKDRRRHSQGNKTREDTFEPNFGEIPVLEASSPTRFSLPHDQCAARVAFLAQQGSEELFNEINGWVLSGKNYKKEILDCRSNRFCPLRIALLNNHETLATRLLYWTRSNIPVEHAYELFETADGNMLFEMMEHGLESSARFIMKICSATDEPLEIFKSLKLKGMSPGQYARKLYRKDHQPWLVELFISKDPATRNRYSPRRTNPSPSGSAAISLHSSLEIIDISKKSKDNSVGIHASVSQPSLQKPSLKKTHHPSTKHHEHCQKDNSPRHETALDTIASSNSEPFIELKASRVRSKTIGKDKISSPHKRETASSSSSSAPSPVGVQVDKKKHMVRGQGSADSLQ